MKKYDIKTVYAYINGEDIEDYSIEELENDTKFMKLVLSLTRDKKLYNLCSNEIKKDPEFIKHLIITFNNDMEFLSIIIEDYIKTSPDLQEFAEIIILLCKYTKHNKETFNKYEKYRELIYLDLKAKIEYAKQEYIGTNLEQEIGMGFIFITNIFSNNKIVLDYFATNYIADIFMENDIDLEEIIHNNFDTYQELEQHGINKYLFSFINKYDKYLSNYVTINRELLQPLLKRLKQIKDEWNLYPEKKEKKQYELMFERVFDYLDGITNSTLDEVELIYYLGEELGISEKIKKYDTFMMDEYYEFIFDTKEIRLEATKFNIYDLKYITDIKKIMLDTLELKDNNKNDKNNLKQRVLKKVLIKTNKEDN